MTAIDPEISMLKAGGWTQVSVRSGPANSSLNENSLSYLAESLDRAWIDPNVRKICLTGEGENFLLGADLRFFVRCVLAGDLDRILRFTRAAHQLLARIEQSEKPIVAWIQGPAYGAGVEIALACHKIVAAPTAKFSLPETGLGIYPGMGGTQRTPRRIGIGLAKWMIFAGAVVPAEQALEIGLIDAICTNVEEAMAAFDRGALSKSVPPRSTRMALLEELFSHNDVASLCNPSFVPMTDLAAIRALVQMRSKAPIALQVLEEIINRGVQLPLAEAIEIEFSQLARIFATEDARI